VNSGPVPQSDVPVLFEEDGTSLVPTTYAVGPWRPDTLHGSAVAALFGSVLDRADVTVARVTVDILTTLRLGPLSLSLSEEEGGRRVRRRTAVLHGPDRPVARAAVLYISNSPESAVASESASARTADHVQQEVAAPPPQPLVTLPESRAGWPGFENKAMALHTTRSEHGDMLGWFRLLVPPLVDHPASGLPAALAAADYTSGATHMVLSLKRWTFMSTDLTLNLVRAPVGDWIGLTAGPAFIGETGVGLAAGVLHDGSGRFARCSQTQFIQPLPPG
jgi:Thioesterase-like superfamily